MKILFWTDGFWPRIGGIETQGLQFIKNLQEKGHQCLVLAQRDYPDWKEDDNYLGITIKRFDFNEIFLKKSLRNLPNIEAYFRGVIEEFQPDILHLNACIGPIGFVFLLFRKMFRMPIILTLHSTYAHDSQIQTIIGKIGSLVDQIGCVSNSVLEEVEIYFPALKNKSRLIYNGVSIPELEPSTLCFSPPILLCLGRLSSEKGFEIAIQAFSLLKKEGSDARLLIVGEGPELEFLRSLVQELGLRDSVQFVGVVTQDRVSYYLNQAAIVIVPSFFESFGLVALESLQMQRPVIASRVGGLTEIISDGDTGLLIPSKDPLVLCKAIQTLLADPGKTVRMGIEGRKRIIEKFSLKWHVEQYENLYRECEWQYKSRSV